MDLVHTPVRTATERCLYQQPDSAQTLREGIAEYHTANPNLFDPETLAKDESLGDLGRFFAAHDACHVLFGLDTSLGDESLADTWTLFGTDVSWRELWSYFQSDGQKQFFKDLFREIGWWKTLTGFVRALPRVFSAMWHSRKMTRKWALHGWEAHLDTPLQQLRQTYGIRLV